MINTDNIDFTDFYNGAAKLLQMYKNELEKQKVNASGTLSNTADFDVDFDDNHITLYFNLAIWWYYVEKGRKPTGGGAGQPWTNSIQELEKWIQNKINKGYWIPRNNRDIPRSPQEITKAAYAIRRKIHELGYYGETHYGLHILEKVLNDAEASGLIDNMIDSVVQGYENEVTVELQKI